MIRTYEIYQNVFCYHCNQPSEDVSTDAVCFNDWILQRDGGISTRFTFLLDTSLNLAALDSHHIGNGICAVDEVFDEQTVSEQPIVVVFVGINFIISNFHTAGLSTSTLLFKLY